MTNADKRKQQHQDSWSEIFHRNSRFKGAAGRSNSSIIWTYGSKQSCIDRRFEVMNGDHRCLYLLVSPSEHSVGKFRSLAKSTISTACAWPSFQTKQMHWSLMRMLCWTAR